MKEANALLLYITVVASVQTMVIDRGGGPQKETVSCGQNQVECDNSKCIVRSWRCDGEDDCGDNSDERNCPTPTCRSDKFECSNGQCIPRNFECDGQDDCSDMSDERNCSSTPSCRSDQFLCYDGRCIASTWQCDGEQDCADSSDERNCSVSCPTDTFDCGNGTRCILPKWVCDGDSDCPGATDEVNCTGTVPPTCRTSEFTCASNMCIHGSWRCDGDADCPDGSDELNCTTNERSCVNGEFRCPDATCINSTKRCDGRRDCPDGNDEAGCSAQAGITIIFANKDSIKAYNTKSKTVKNIATSLSLAVAIDCDYHSRLMFWSDIISRSIYSASISSDGNISNTTRVIENTAAHGPSEGLAVDWINMKLYWTNQEASTIDTSDLLGSSRRTLVENELDKPRGIAVDPIERLLFFSDWGYTPKIERIGLDGNGSTRQVIVLYRIERPNGIALDYSEKKVFWVDAGLKQISSIRYDGTGRRVIYNVASNIGYPFGVAVFQNNIYWTDWSSRSIRTVIKDGTTGFEVLVGHPTAIPYGICVYDPLAKPTPPTVPPLAIEDNVSW